MTFRCNICDATSELPADGFPRDAPSCGGCGSTVRLRALIRALSLELFGCSLALSDFPVVKSVRGLGVSDEPASAERLASKLDYRNTFYHQPPYLDIAEGAPAEQVIYDFVLAADVFEHVAGPPGAALRNAAALLKPHGFLAMTVPYAPEAATREHFSSLHEYGLVKAGSHIALVNRTSGGEWQVFDRLVFHGGCGSTLEMRVFGEADLRGQLAEAGFPNVEFAIDDDPAFGIVHRESWSLPVIARKATFRQSRRAVAEIVAQHVRQSECLRRTEAEKTRLENLCRELHAHLETVNADLREKAKWAQSLREEIERGGQEIARLQDQETQLREELEVRISASQAMERELRSWAADLENHLQQSNAEVKRLQAEFEDRTRWALSLKSDLEQKTEEAGRLSRECESLRRRLGAWEASRWSHLGQAFGAGPRDSKPAGS